VSKYAGSKPHKANGKKIKVIAVVCGDTVLILQDFYYLSMSFIFFLFKNSCHSKTEL
jgi:hypothetical protein